MKDEEADRLEGLLVEVEAKDARTREAIVATNAEPPEDPDDYYIDLAGRLELPLVPPTYRSSNGRTTCNTCGAHAGSREVHTRWHLRVQAVTKVAAHLSELAWKHSGLLGLTLSTVLSEATREDPDGT